MLLIQYCNPGIESWVNIATIIRLICWKFESLVIFCCTSYRFVKFPMRLREIGGYLYSDPAPGNSFCNRACQALVVVQIRGAKLRFNVL
jgi:hypothetical protein